jgi:hypothetical protein
MVTVTVTVADAARTLPLSLSSRAVSGAEDVSRHATSTCTRSRSTAMDAGSCAMYAVLNASTSNTKGSGHPTPESATTTMSSVA